MSYIITRQVNGKEFYLENIYDNHVLWVTNKTEALSFDDEARLRQFIKREFPNRNYYTTRRHRVSSSGGLTRSKGLGYR